MAETVVLVASVVAAVAAGLLGGVYLAFSTAVMGALAQRPAAEGAAAMQAINRTILNPLFLTLFVGTTLLCAALVVASPFVDAPGTVWRVAGAFLLLVGSTGVTAAVNVPLNTALAEVDPASDAAATLWTRYLQRWTAANHVRAVASALGATLLVLSVT